MMRGSGHGVDVGAHVFAGAHSRARCPFLRAEPTVRHDALNHGARDRDTKTGRDRDMAVPATVTAVESRWLEARACPLGRPSHKTMASLDDHTKRPAAARIRFFPSYHGSSARPAGLRARPPSPPNRKRCTRAAVGPVVAVTG